MQRMATALALVIAAFVAFAPTAQASTFILGKWSPGVDNVKNAIYFAFCGHRYVRCSAGDEAIRVAYCETGGTYSTWAENGQYRNIFQMGKWERQTYGWHDVGSDPWTAAKAAYNYYEASGGWYRWDCKP